MAIYDRMTLVINPFYTGIRGGFFLLLVGMSTEKGGQQHLIKLVNKL